MTDGTKDITEKFQAEPLEEAEDRVTRRSFSSFYSWCTSASLLVLYINTTQNYGSITFLSVLQYYASFNFTENNGNEEKRG